VRSIEDIIEDWKAECGTLKQGRTSQYVAIEFGVRLSLLIILVKTMIDEGHTEDDITGVQTRNKAIAACTPPDSVPIPTKNIKTWKKIVAGEWSMALRKFFNGGVSEVEEKVVEAPAKVEVKAPPKPEMTPEQLLEEIMQPKNRLQSAEKIDRSADTNWELLAELGMLPDGAPTNE
jgi:hypothetical protein